MREEGESVFGKAPPSLSMTFLRDTLDVIVFCVKLNLFSIAAACFFPSRKLQIETELAGGGLGKVLAMVISPHAIILYKGDNVHFGESV